VETYTQPKFRNAGCTWVISCLSLLGIAIWWRFHSSMVSHILWVAEVIPAAKVHTSRSKAIVQQQINSFRCRISPLNRLPKSIIGFLPVKLAKSQQFCHAIPRISGKGIAIWWRFHSSMVSHILWVAEVPLLLRKNVKHKGAAVPRRARI